MRNALLISVLAIGLGAASPAAATDAADAVSVPVGMADLDLSKPADAARLRARLGRAATAACAAPGISSVRERLSFVACKTAALSVANLKAEQAVATARMAGSAEIKTARR